MDHKINEAEYCLAGTTNEQMSSYGYCGSKGTNVKNKNRT